MISRISSENITLDGGYPYKKTLLKRTHSSSKSK